MPGISSLLRSATRGGRRSRGHRGGPRKQTWRWVTLYNIIPELIAAVEVEAQRKAAETAKKIEVDAKARAPVKTGHLRSSIVAQSAGKEAFVAAEAEYAAFVEFGTYKMAARPYLSPAVEANKAEFLNWAGFFDSFK